METWIWISLWVVQTIVGAVLWKKFAFNKDTEWALFYSATIFMNIVGLIALIFIYSCYFIDFLAGVKRQKKNDNI